MKYTFLFTLAVALLAACNGDGNNSYNNDSTADSSSMNSTPNLGRDTTSTVSDTVNISRGSLSSGNNANGNTNAGSMYNDTLPMGAERNRSPDSIKAKVMNQK